MPTADAAPASRHSDILTVLRPVRGRLAVAAVLQMASSVLVLAPLIGVGELARILLDTPVDGGRGSTVVLVSTGLLAAGFALRGAADLVTHLADNAFTLDLRRTLAARLSAAPLGWFTDHASGQIKQGMQDDVSALHHLIGHALTNLVAAVTTPLVVYGYLLLVDWRLALVLFTPLPVFVLMYRRMLAGSAPKMDEYGRVLADVNNAVVEFVGGIGVVKTFGRSGHAHHAYRVAVDRFTEFFVGWARPLIRPESIAATLLAPVTMILLTLGFGAVFVATGTMDGVDLIPFALLGTGVSTPVTTLVSGSQTLQLARGAATRIRTLLDVPVASEHPDPLVPTGTTVDIDRVSFSYDGKHRVLHDVTLRLEPGTVTALVGASGSGKSTLARLLLRFFDPSNGCIRIGGAALERISSDELYRTVGFVFQEAPMLRATMAENIALGRPDATGEEIRAAARAANIDDRICRLSRGYDSVHGEDAQLSGGEAQRVGVARALLLDPPVLVLDEPTSAADVESERAVQDALSTLVSRTGAAARTILVIAHRLDTVTQVDTVVVLAAGQIVERGSHQELLDAGGHYAALWGAQHPDTSMVR